MSQFCFIADLHKIQKAKTKVKVTTHYRRQERLAKVMSKAVSMNLVKGIKSFRKKVSVDAIETAWRSGAWPQIMSVIPWETLPEDLLDYDVSMGETWTDAMDLTIESLPAPFRKSLRFDINNPRIRRYINQHVGRRITDLHLDAQKVVQRAVQKSFTHALTPRSVAERIKLSIGLDPRRELALQNYRDALIASGSHSTSKVDTLTDKYADRLLDSRAMAIARTETRQATSQGQLSVWREASNQGFLPKTSRKTWVVDGNPCEICEPMDGVSVPLDGFWTLSTGESVEVPSEAHTNCLCGMEISFGENDEE